MNPSLGARSRLSCLETVRQESSDPCMRRQNRVKQPLTSLPVEVAAIEQRVLPSTSPAHAALSFERKLERWRVVVGDARE